MAAFWENEPKVGVPGAGWLYDSLSITYDDLPSDIPPPEDVETEERPIAYDGIGTSTVWANEQES